MRRKLAGYSRDAFLRSPMRAAVPTVIALTATLDRGRSGLRRRRHRSGHHTCALLGDGTARCWGYNFNGQLGDGTTTTRGYPAPVATYG